MEEEARKEAIRKRLQERQVGKRLETLAMSLTPASEYYTDQEIQVKFKKPKKKVTRFLYAYIMFEIFSNKIYN